MTHPYRSRSTLRRALAPLLALWLVLAGLPGTAVAQPPGGAPLTDLPALLLMPADAEAEGQPWMRLGEGRAFMTIGEAMAPETYAYSRVQMNLSLLPGAEGMLRDAGWQRFHEVTLVMPDTSGSVDVSLLDVVSSIEEYATPDGAARAFDALATEQALRTTIDSTVVVDPGATPAGDQSIAWSSSGTSDVSGDPVAATAQMVRVGNRIVSTAITDHTSPYAVDPLQRQRLTGRLLDRVERIGTAGQPCPPAGPIGVRAEFNDRSGLHLPGLGSCVLRLTRDEALPYRAAYTLVDGTAIQIWNETPEELAERQAEAETVGVRDEYQVQYIIDRDGRQAFSYVYIASYRDEATAAARFDGLEQRLRADAEERPGASFAPGAPAVGDASATYAWTTASTGHAVTSSAARVDNVVVTVRFSQTTAPVPAATQALLQSQVACMQAGDCAQPVPVPPEVVPALAT